MHKNKKLILFKDSIKNIKYNKDNNGYEIKFKVPIVINNKDSGVIVEYIINYKSESKESLDIGVLTYLKNVENSFHFQKGHKFINTIHHKMLIKNKVIESLFIQCEEDVDILFNSSFIQLTLINSNEIYFY